MYVYYKTLSCGVSTESMQYGGCTCVAPRMHICAVLGLVLIEYSLGPRLSKSHPKIIALGVYSSETQPIKELGPRPVLGP